MKFKIPFLPLVALIVVASVSITPGCKDDSDPNDKGPACSIANADLSYSKNMKSLIDRLCISCHSGSGPGPLDYRTFAGIKPVLDNGKVLEEVVIDKTMPQSGVTMTQSQRDSVNCWIKAGYPQ